MEDPVKNEAGAKRKGDAEEGGEQSEKGGEGSGNIIEAMDKHVEWKRKRAMGGPGGDKDESSSSSRERKFNVE